MRAILLAFLGLWAGAAAAAECRLPAAPEPVPAETEPPCPASTARLRPAWHLLALSWSPEFCRPEGRAATHPHQCRDNRFGWVVHGLWPQAQGGKGRCGNPRFCRGRDLPEVAESTVRDHACLVPGAALINHQWRAHGACAFAAPEAYLDAIAGLMAGWQPPDPEQVFAKESGPLAMDLKAAFVAAWPRLTPEAIRVRADGKHRLTGIDICLNRELDPMPCPKEVGGAPDWHAVRVTRR